MCPAELLCLIKSRVCILSAAHGGGRNLIAELLGILGHPNLLGLAVDIHILKLEVHVEVGSLTRGGEASDGGGNSLDRKSVV